MTSQTPDPLGPGALLLHNPRCSKSRAAREILEASGVEYTERQYLGDPLSAAELEALRARLDRPVREWTRHKESAYAQAGLSDSSSDGELLDAMARYPVLIERPIFLNDRGAVICRPPERIHDLIEPA